MAFNAREIYQNSFKNRPQTIFPAYAEIMSIISNEKEAKESVQLEFVGGTVRMTGQQQTQCTSLR